MTTDPERTQWRDLAALLRRPPWQGTGPIQLVAAEPFYDEEDLPFAFWSLGAVCRLVPDPGFPKESLVATEEEQLLVIDDPEEEGWLCPEETVAHWLGRNVSNPTLEDILLSHPLYEYLTALDEDGHSRGGHRGDLVQWSPGAPTVASIYPPEFLPNDADAPPVNRDRDAYADGVMDLLEQLEAAFELLEVEVALRAGEEPLPTIDWDDEPEQDDDPYLA